MHQKFEISRYTKCHYPKPVTDNHGSRLLKQILVYAIAEGSLGRK